MVDRLPAGGKGGTWVGGNGGLWYKYEEGRGKEEERKIDLVWAGVNGKKYIHRMEDRLVEIENALAKGKARIMGPRYTA